MKNNYFMVLIILITFIQIFIIVNGELNNSSFNNNTNKITNNSKSQSQSLHSNINKQRAKIPIKNSDEALDLYHLEEKEKKQPQQKQSNYKHLNNESEINSNKSEEIKEKKYIQRDGSNSSGEDNNGNSHSNKNTTPAFKETQLESESFEKIGETVYINEGSNKESNKEEIVKVDTNSFNSSISSDIKSEEKNENGHKKQSVDEIKNDRSGKDFIINPNNSNNQIKKADSQENIKNDLYNNNNKNKNNNNNNKNNRDNNKNNNKNLENDNFIHHANKQEIDPYNQSIKSTIIIFGFGGLICCILIYIIYKRMKKPRKTRHVYLNAPHFEMLEMESIK
ncbi:hypothetical protein DICPUDRAFT_154326 [Dictyostelium purpureum]|uniref:Uncharacterized protein n=1 Tax=Dictyostelium purpureum TaxID=5786 RepID=F0ZR19_DICPU|nr:uncharacterized protein DICPUDRAFT_154326 [Dictyostelium purpureum]EGC33594.1 hypothetical protein DICPUDRAFT_154326 [Dictyostelium purpureum]|eukprot:XP_003289862.1 hypothetical protein DICPUDRAFT_154326 [Dictyostelium purpureum]